MHSASMRCADIKMEAFRLNAPAMIDTALSLALIAAKFQVDGICRKSGIRCRSIGASSASDRPAVTLTVPLQHSNRRSRSRRVHLERSNRNMKSDHTLAHPNDAAGKSHAARDIDEQTSARPHFQGGACHQAVR